MKQGVLPLIKPVVLLPWYRALGARNNDDGW